MPDQINPQLYLQDYFRQKKDNLKKEIDALTSPPKDRSDYVAQLKAKYRIHPLAFKNTEVTSTNMKTVSKRLMGEHWTDKVQEIKVNINYNGDKILLNCKPVNYSRVFPQHRHALYANVLTVYIELAEPNAELFNRELKSFMGEISKNFERINNQTDLFNDELSDLIEKLLKVKQDQFEKQAVFLQRIGLKVNPRSEEFMTPSPIQRKAVPQPSAEKINGVIIPVLESKVYNDIREVLYNVGQAVERKPSLYQGKREEHLRDIFLLFLETRYESTTGAGEAFNKKGKTDILLKHAPDGSNVFVAECKFWKGQKSLFEAIDQLLGYLTWRDTKTALMLFVKQPEITNALEVVSLYINRHPQFRRLVGTTHNTSFAYEMSLPGDPNSSVWVEFMIFHFPA